MLDTTIHTVKPREKVSKQDQLIPEEEPDRVTKPKEQPWKGVYAPDASIVPQTFSLHDKPWYRVEDLDEAYDSVGGS